MNILAPSFLVQNIELIGLVMGVMVLVIFDDFVSGKLILPAADFIKTKIFEKSMSLEQVKRYKKIVRYFSEFIATAFFIAYCYIGYAILAEYVIIPILTRLQNVILIIVVLAFLLISYVFNNRRLRKKYLIG